MNSHYELVITSDCTLYIVQMYVVQSVLPTYDDDDDFFIFILLSRESDGGAMRRTNPDSLRSCLCFQVFRLNFLLTSLICCLPDSTKQR